MEGYVMMKKVAASALVALAISGCQKAEVAETTPETPVSTPTPAPAVAAVAPEKKDAAEVTPPVAPEPPKQELAPEGVFYLISLARVETSDGIVGLKPGTGVKRVRPGIYLTPYGELPLADNQVTNDMALARQAANQDSAQQVQLKKALEAQARATTPAPSSANTAVVQSQPPAPTQTQPAAATSQLGSGTMLNSNAPGSLGLTHSATKDKVYTDSTGRKFWRDARGRARYDF